MNLSILILMLAMLGGCAASYTQPAIRLDHPASAAAVEAPLPEPTRTLALTGVEPVQPTPRSGGMEHLGHGMADRADPAPSMPVVNATAPVREPTPPTQPGAAAAAAIIYACPMHPEITSDEPGQRCPRCGMALKPIPPPTGAPR